MNETQEKFNLAKLKTPLILIGFFWGIALILWQVTGKIFFLFNFGYIGTAVGGGIAIYGALPQRKRWIGRRLAQFLVGGYMLVFLGFIERENMQIEGFFFYLLQGIFAGSVIHYLVAKVGGPLVFHRGWCGWSCWTAMLLDLLPYRRNKNGRLKGHWEALRYVHFAASLALVLVLWLVQGYRVESQSLTELWWLLGGNLLYYAVAFSLAFALKDNRAFCKYVCPIPTLQKIGARFSMLKIAAEPQRCNDCGACARVCPMDIDIPKYAKEGLRVMSSECILCMECMDACPQKALSVTFKLDGWKSAEYLRRRS